MQTLELVAIAAFNRPTDSSSPGDYLYILDLCEIISNHFDALLNHGLLWDATRIFCIYCNASHRYDLVLDLYRKLVLAFEGEDLFSSLQPVSSSDKERLICGIVANEALLRFPTSCDLDESLQPDARSLRLILHNRSGVLFDKLFCKLNDPPPRGRRIQDWRITALQLSLTTMTPADTRHTNAHRENMEMEAEILASMAAGELVSHRLQDQSLSDAGIAEPPFRDYSSQSQSSLSRSTSSEVPSQSIIGRTKRGSAAKPRRESLQRTRSLGEIQSQQKKLKEVREQDWAEFRLERARRRLDMTKRMWFQ